MAVRSKRKHPRIPYNGKVDLTFNGVTYPACTPENLSLIGMWVHGCQDQPEGTPCDIEFHDAAKTANRPLRIKGEVVRVEEKGIALIFLDMNMRAYTDLEQLISDNAGDCFTGAEEFIERLPE